MFVRKASAVLKTVTEHTVSECADKLLDVLVHADRADRSYVGLITDSIVKMVHGRRQPDTKLINVLSNHMFVGHP